jgi:hypothetical protein
MTEHEYQHIQSIVVHNLLGSNEALQYFKLAACKMPALKEFRIVYVIDNDCHINGEGEMRLSEVIPCGLDEFYEMRGT